MRTRALAVSALIALSLAGCGKTVDTSGNAAAPASSSSATSEDTFPTPEPSDLMPTPSDSESESEAATTFEQVNFGDVGSFTQDNDNEFTVVVQKPTKAKCQYEGIGCARPKTGDKVITAKVTIKNTGSQAISVSSNLFVIEFADGTRLQPGDESAMEYQPESAMDYDHTIRPKGTYTSTLTFEAPKSGYQIIMLTGEYDGEDLRGWK